MIGPSLHLVPGVNQRLNCGSIDLGAMWQSVSDLSCESIVQLTLQRSPGRWHGVPAWRHLQLGQLLRHY